MTNRRMPWLACALVTLSCATPAAARELLLSCETVEDASGDTQHQSIRIDPDAHVVRQGEMTFTDGAESPLSPKVLQFIEIDRRHATWGQRNRNTGHYAGLFTVDLATGTYSFDSEFRGRLGHGTCHTVDSAI